MSVNNIFFNPTFPQVLETQLLLSPSVKARMVDTVLLQKDTANYHGGYTFQVKDQHGDFKILYNFFFNILISRPPGLDSAQGKLYQSFLKLLVMQSNCVTNCFISG